MGVVQNLIDEADGIRPDLNAEQISQMISGSGINDISGLADEMVSIKVPPKKPNGLRNQERCILASVSVCLLQTRVNTHYCRFDR